MIEKLINLLERFVTAFEKIADTQTKCDCSCKKEETKPEIKDIPRDYEGIAKQPDGRDILLKFCNDKGIEVPSGTRTTTLVKMLNDYVSEVDISSGQTEVNLEPTLIVESKPESVEPDNTEIEYDFGEEVTTTEPETTETDESEDWFEEWDDN